MYGKMTAAIVVHPSISRTTSLSLREWRDEMKLAKTDGTPLTLNQLCTIILEDFAEEYRETKRLMEEEEVSG